MSKGVCYYTDSRLVPWIAEPVRAQLARAAQGLPLVSVSLAPLDFGQNIVLPLERGRLTMFTQILTGLEALDTDVAFHAEHDLLYHPSHFAFEPPREDCYYYNGNVWRVDAKTGRAVWYVANHVSCLCANRRLLVEHYRKVVERVTREGWTAKLGYEPGNHPPPRGVDSVPSARWMSAQPNLDLRHRQTLSQSKWSLADFRDKRGGQGWTEADAVPGWGQTKDRMPQLLASL